MKATVADSVFVVRDHLQGRTSLMWAEDVAQVEGALLRQLEHLEPGRTLVVDFRGIGISSDAARQLLRRGLLRLRGEWKDRTLVLDRLERGNVYNVKAMLLSEHLAVPSRLERGTTILGEVEPALVETFEFAVLCPSVTAKDIQQHFALNTVAAGTNRLSRLAQIGAVRRVGQEPVEGGGLQYRYAAVR